MNKPSQHLVSSQLRKMRFTGQSTVHYAIETNPHSGETIYQTACLAHNTPGNTAELVDTPVSCHACVTAVDNQMPVLWALPKRVSYGSFSFVHYVDATVTDPGYFMSLCGAQTFGTDRITSRPADCKDCLEEYARIKSLAGDAGRLRVLQSECEPWKLFDLEQPSIGDTIFVILPSPFATEQWIMSGGAYCESWAPFKYWQPWTDDRLVYELPLPPELSGRFLFLPTMLTKDAAQ